MNQVYTVIKCCIGRYKLTNPYSLVILIFCGLSGILNISCARNIYSSKVINVDSKPSRHTYQNKDKVIIRTTIDEQNVRLSIKKVASCRTFQKFRRKKIEITTVRSRSHGLDFTIGSILLALGVGTVITTQFTRSAGSNLPGTLSGVVVGIAGFPFIINGIVRLAKNGTTRKLVDEKNMKSDQRLIPACRSTNVGQQQLSLVQNNSTIYSGTTTNQGRILAPIKSISIQKEHFSKPVYIELQGKQYPTSLRGQEIYQAKSTIIEKRFWNKVTLNRNLRGYKKYLARYPDGVFKEQAVWKIIRTSRGFTPYIKYLQAYPDGQFSEKAKSKLRPYIDKFQPQLRKAFLWKNTVAASQVYQRYLQLFPWVSNAQKLKSIIYVLRRSRGAPAIARGSCHCYRRIRKFMLTYLPSGQKEYCYPKGTTIRVATFPNSHLHVFRTWNGGHGYFVRQGCPYSLQSKMWVLGQGQRRRSSAGFTLFKLWAKAMTKKVGELHVARQNLVGGSRRKYFRARSSRKKTKGKIYKIKICCFNPPFFVDCKRHSRTVYIPGRSCVDAKKQLKRNTQHLRRDTIMCKQVRRSWASIFSCRQAK